MKRLKIRANLILIIAISILALFPLVVNATETTYTATSTINGVTVNWSYELNESNEIINLKCTNPTEIIGNITIPENLDGKTVVTIGSYACESATGLTEVTIPDSVEKIGINAFENCTNLTRVNLPEGLKEFGWNVFEGCTGLTEFTIPKNVTSAQTIFKGCTNLTKVTFEDGIKTIPAYVCSGVEGLTEVTIPDSVEKIGINAFENCTNLKKVTILDNVKDMGWGMAQSNDSVFINHNEDLTIYCYKDSMAANYAIKYNIKYVYLTKPSTDIDTDKVTDNKTDTDKEIIDTNKEDDTTITVEYPKAGLTTAIGAIILSIGVATIILSKYRKLRDI